MAQQFAVDDDFQSTNPRYADAFVIFSVTVLSLAIGAWLLTRLSVGLWAGAVGAVIAYVSLLSLHLMVRRSMVASASPAEDHPVVGQWGRAADGPAGHPGTEEVAEAAPSPEEEAARWAEATNALERRLDEELPKGRPGDPFSFRPKQEPALANAPPAPPAFVARAGEATTEPRPMGVSQPDLSVELVQDLIKKLADELNGAASGDRDAKPAPANETEAMIGRSVAALQAMTRSLQPAAGESATPAPAVDVPTGGIASWWPGGVPAAQPPAQRAPVAPPALNPQLARIAEAVAAERMEVLLEPIHALVEGRPRHFEVSVRLLTADGAALEQGDFARAARGSGLMPSIDAARMIRAARVARRLGERGRQGSVLAAMAGESLADPSFLDAATEEALTGGGMGLVLSFAQSEVRAFTVGHAQAIGALAAAGLRFALEEVTDLDMDFAALKQMGFDFVELDAPVFLDGLPHAGGRVPASDICRHLADFGLSLVVGRIEDDWLLARILGFGVLFGKGTLFGSPRLVKDEVVAAPAVA
jgi:cyclic-di-GMP phosphodiesterase TipF (flagellum assembly factor)